ncbi:hypothetical protein [Schleiferilactobacillus perolens]|uniref:Uncharacterized protein n=1 Tax=Schleiferilactobacillus perolens DSM 12744 TaxID=1423792 RepID=A0A0R1N8Z8_9LACO|nr:hypothetical protein [Schleiferilactobacillus perolens]KRL13387.1 hypothetical protein FD09_GL002218 [Schleiferilactobacillus perolens DSM 12744]
MFKRFFSNIGGLILINLVVLILITIWAAYYSFGPMLLMGRSKASSWDDFIWTEIIIGGGFLVLFNGYVLYRTVTGKNREYNRKLTEEKNKRNKRK